MKEKSKKSLFTAIGFFLSFVFWTILVCCVDVKDVGVNGTAIGLSTLNFAFNQLIGAHLSFYYLTDWLGLISIAISLSFAVLGVWQLFKRKSILKVDGDILALGVFYMLVATAYIIFEFVTVNYRPILIGGRLEKSYPSSTTLLAICVMTTTAMQLKVRLKNSKVKFIAIFICVAFLTFMVIGRIISGVHWISDIIGGVLLSYFLISLYTLFVGCVKDKKCE